MKAQDREKEWGESTQLFGVSSHPGLDNLHVNGLECLSIIFEELWEIGKYLKIGYRKTMP